MVWFTGMNRRGVRGNQSGVAGASIRGRMDGVGRRPPFEHLELHPLSIGDELDAGRAAIAIDQDTVLRPEVDRGSALRETEVEAAAIKAEAGHRRVPGYEPGGQEFESLSGAPDNQGIAELQSLFFSRVWNSPPRCSASPWSWSPDEACR